MTALCMSLLLAAGLGCFGWTAWRRLRLLRAAARPHAVSGTPAQRLGLVVKYVFGQARMFRYSAAGIAHALIFAGFVVLAIRTLAMFGRGYTGVWSGFGFWLFDDYRLLGPAYLLLKDVIGAGVIAGVVYFLHQRLVVKPRRMELSVEGVFILCMIMGIILSDVFYEAGAIAAGDGVHFHWTTPVASLVALPLNVLPDPAVLGVSQAGFWLHAIIVLTFLNFLPYGKHFHVLTILPQVYFSRPQPHGTLEPIANIEGKLERGETLGVKTARDLSWKDVLDLYTCTECGRCSDHCPATNTGKLLSPKHLTMNLRDHMYRNEGALLQGTASGVEPGKGPAATIAAIENLHLQKRHTWTNKEGTADTTGGELIGSWIDPEVLWACTTCGACEQECPVFISYIDKIVDLRRNLVMEQGAFPTQLQNAFRGLETVQNPYSFDNAQRAEWAAGLNIPLKSEKPDAEVLYWVGCAPSYDDRSKKIARAMAQLMQKAGVDFAILGPEECCTGDPARRAGNEYLFEMLARQNVETLKNHAVKRIVTTCPHCFNTLKNEYPQFGGSYEVVHHTTFLAELIAAGRLKPQQRVEGTVAYHDACYLGRHNGIYDPPRDVLRAIPGLRVVDAPQSRDRGMCCGAGGAQMWKEEEPIRRPGSREGDGKVNHARVRQLLKVLPTAGAAEPRKVASACPFCKTMLNDGLKDQGHDDVEQTDVAELLWRSIEPPAATG